MTLDAKLLEKAILFATEKHKGQTRKGNGLPYILHPMSVLQILSQIKKSKNQILLAIACLLHDVVEDCDVTIEEIAKEFGYKVASIVYELTSDKDEIERLGKEIYLLQKMLGMSSYSLCIKLCDRLHNLNDMESMSTEFKVKTVSQTRFIIEGLKDRKLTKTHRKIIKLINSIIEKY